MRAADELSKDGKLGMRPPEEPAARIAFGAAVDVTIGGLLAAGCDLATLEATRTVRGVATARLAARQRELLDGVGLFDDRALADAIGVEGLGGPVVVRGDADMTPQLLALLLRMHRALRRDGMAGVTIALPRIAGDIDPLASVAALVEQRYADESDAPEIEWEEPPHAVNVEAVEAAHPEAEARFATAAIVRALQRGTAIDRIAIAVPGETEALLEALRASLDEASVPFSEARGPAASAAPEVRALLVLTEMAASRIERDAVIEVLRTPGLHAGSWVDARYEADAERRATILAHRLRELPLARDRSGELFVEAVLALVRGEDEAWMATAVRRLVDVVTSIRGVTGRAAFAKLVADLVHRLRLGSPSPSELERVLQGESSGGARLALVAIGEGSFALREALGATAEIARAASLLAMDEARGGLEELLAEVRLDLGRSSTAARGAAARAGAVRIASPRELAGIEHDLVVVMGLRARAYGGEGATDPWLDERTLASIPAAARPRSIGARRAVRSAEIAWATAWSREVVLTRSATDEEGREAEPAHEIFTAALARGATVRREPASRVSGRASTPSARSAELVLLAAGQPPAPELWARVGIERDRRAFFLEPARSAGAYSGRIPDRSLAALSDRFGGHSLERSVSVSSIERAAGCAFRAFSERVLGARRIEDALETASARDRGTLLHEALHVAFDRRRELGPSATREQVLAEAERAIRIVLGLGSPMSPLHAEALGLVMRDALAVLADTIDNPDPLGYVVGERRFGRGEPTPFEALEVRSSRGSRVFVDGQIDRIDRVTDGSRLEVVDYKTGKAPARKAVGETVFQLPLYALAAKRVFGGDQVSGVYVVVKPGGGIERSPRKPSDTIFEASELERIAESAANVVERVWSGDVAPRPAHPRYCVRCDARDICRRPAVIPKSDGPVDALENSEAGGPMSSPGGEGSEP